MGFTAITLSLLFATNTANAVYLSHKDRVGTNIEEVPQKFLTCAIFLLILSSGFILLFEGCATQREKLTFQTYLLSP